MGTNGIGCTEWERDFDPKTEQPYRRSDAMTPIPKRDEVEAVAREGMSLSAEIDWHVRMITHYGSDADLEAFGAAMFKRKDELIAALDGSRAREKGGELAERLWPLGCAHPGTCERHGRCMYFGCEYAADTNLPAQIATARAKLIAPAPGQSEAIRAEVIAQGVDPNSDEAERMGRAERQDMLRKASK